jgi:hypothetical protein
MISSNGVALGTNSITPLLPLNIPVSVPANALKFQIGLLNSSIGLGTIPSMVPTASSTTYTPGAYTYTVPSTVNSSNVVGVMIYCWGAGGSWSHYQSQNTSQGNALGGGGGFMSGFYGCPGGTILQVVSGIHTTVANISSGGGNGARMYNTATSFGGGFSAVFNGSYATSTCLLLAGGGGAAASINSLLNNGNGGGGGYPSGSPPYQVSANGTLTGFSTTITGGTQTTGGSSYYGAPLTYSGTQWFASQTNNVERDGLASGGGGWFGGGAGISGIGTYGGAGGSSYFNPSLVSSVSYSNGTTYTQFVTPTQVSNYALAPPGGLAVMSNFGLSTYGNGVGTQGLVIIVPMVGTPGSVAVGAEARFIAV